MNIVIIGGGEPGKFGNDFALRMRNDGHHVYIISHKDYKTSHPHDIVANFSTVQEVIDSFNEVTKNVDIIDMIIFNSNNGSYPGHASCFTSTSTVDLARWEATSRIGNYIPHALGIEALKRMKEDSKIIFMISRMAVEFDRTSCTDLAGYAGTKAIQAHMMLAFAEHNNKGAISTAIAPHFVYESPDTYKQVFELMYNYINNITKQNNGKIMCVNAGANPPRMFPYINT